MLLFLKNCYKIELTKKYGCGIIFYICVKYINFDVLNRSAKRNGQKKS